MKNIIIGTMGCLLAGTLVLGAADVKTNWDNQCTKCHGEDGSGKTKMGRKLKVNDYTDPKVQAMLKDDEMFVAIRDGVKEGSRTVMKPAENMTEQEMKDLVAYIRSFAKK